jgi:hypothetical protein
MKIEITKGSPNPVTEFFSSPSNTPETDAAVKESEKWRRPLISTSANGITWDGPVVALCRKLERERNDARELAEQMSESNQVLLAELKGYRKLQQKNSCNDSKFREI